MQAATPVICAVALVVLATCSTDVGDQACTVESQYDDKDDRCPYGSPGGPKLQSDNGCPSIEMSPAAGCETWESAVFPMLKRDPSLGDASGGACTRAACHGAGTLGGSRVVIPDDANQAFNNLKEYAPAGRPYVSDVEGVKQTSFILCNLQAQPGGGKQMPIPPTLMSASDLQVVKDWAGCGMPRGAAPEGTGGSGGMGGSGGTGGGGAGVIAGAGGA